LEEGEVREWESQWEVVRIDAVLPVQNRRFPIWDPVGLKKVCRWDYSVAAVSVAKEGMLKACRGLGLRAHVGSNREQ